MLWQPKESRAHGSQMFHFLNHINKKYRLDSLDYHSLHRWSVESTDVFWKELISFYPLQYEGSLEPVNTDGGFDSYGWFPNVKLNFAENLLHKGHNKQVALNFVHESGLKSQLCYAELRKKTAQLQEFLKPHLKPGDVLAAYMPHLPETIISMLAAAATGATFTSTSSDFGAEGVVDRFSQSKPKVLVAATHYSYNGKIFDQIPKLKQILKQLPSVQQVILVDFLNQNPSLQDLPQAVMWPRALENSAETPLYYKQNFSAPLYIMYSSGTTGKPKCIVHSVGGTLLQHIKELGLHTDLTEKKNIFYFTTCGWMMWNWLVSSLYFGSTLTLYEGSPAYPSVLDFFDIINQEKIHIFGTSPKFLKALEDQWPADFKKDFPTLETILSTGAPLLPEQFDFLYQKVKADMQVSSISGGTDIIGCFMLGNPLLPVDRGEIQCLGLGMDVACYNDQGQELIDQEGELVCKKSFPSRPIVFLNDPDDKKMKEAYFNRFPGVWHHGDFIAITHNHTVRVYGRSDSTLNPGGVRIGTSEIYRQTEALNYIEDSLCVGRQNSGDVDILLFVKMKPGENLSDLRIKEIQSLIRKNTTPRHVPKEVHAIQGIPYTRSGKKMELAVTRLVNHKELNNIEAIANPECLDEYISYRLQ